MAAERRSLAPGSWAGRWRVPALLAVPSLLFLGALAPGCAGPLTGVVLTVLTDLEVPGELSDMQMKISVARSDDVVDLPVTLGPGGYQLPGTLGLYSDGGAQLTIQLVGQGRKGRVERRARLTLVKDKVLALSLSLVRDCLNVTCDNPDSTCVESGACVSIDIDSGSLGTFDPDHPGATVECGDYLDSRGRRLASRRDCDDGRTCRAGRCVRLGTDGGVIDGGDGPGADQDGGRDGGEPDGDGGPTDVPIDSAPECQSGVSCAGGAPCDGDCIDDCCYPNGCVDCNDVACATGVCGDDGCCVAEPFCPLGPSCDRYDGCDPGSDCVNNCCVPQSCSTSCDTVLCMPPLICYDGCCGDAPQCLTGPPCDAFVGCPQGSSCGSDHCCAPDSCAQPCDSAACGPSQLCANSGDCCVPDITCPSGPSWDRWRFCPAGLEARSDQCCYPMQCTAPCTQGPCSPGEVCFARVCCGPAPACPSGRNCDRWTQCPSGFFCDAGNCCVAQPDGGPPDAGPPDMTGGPDSFGPDSIGGFDGPPPVDMTAGL